MRAVLNRPNGLIVAGLAMLAGPPAVAVDPPPAARVTAIAAMLPEVPGCPGRPAEDRAAWERLAAKPEFSRVVADAARLAATPLPASPDELYLDFSKTGNRRNWERVAGQRRSRLTTFSLAEALEGQGRFIAPLTEAIAAICTEPTWVMPAHDRDLADFQQKIIRIDLASSNVGWTLATINWLLGDRLPAATRQMIVENVERRVLASFERMATNQQRADWWVTTTNNWNSVCLAGVVGAALAQEPSRERRAFFAVAGELYSKSFLRGFTPDGYCSEGVGYWNYGFGHYLLLSELIEQATGGQVSLLSLPEARMPALYGSRIVVQHGVCAAFADCGVTARPMSLYTDFLERRLGLKPTAAEWEQTVTSGSLGELLIFNFPNSASATPPVTASATADEQLRSWFPDAGVLLARPGPGGTLAVGLKGGHNAEHHNHNDVGSYTVVVDATPVILDPGGEVYTARTFSSRRYESKLLNSYGHPVPIVAGTLQRTGREAQGQVLNTTFTPLIDTIRLDLRSAYPVESLTRLERTFVYSREATGSLRVTDEVEFSSPQEFGTAIVTQGAWVQEDDGSLTVMDFDQAVRVTIAARGGEVAITADELDEDVGGRPKPTRIGINFTAPITAGSIAVTIRPTQLATADPGNLLINGNFRYGTFGWRLASQGSLVEQPSLSGGRSLKVHDPSKETGSNIDSAAVRVPGAGRYRLSGQSFHESGEGIGMYVRFLSESGELLNESRTPGWLEPVGSLTGKVGEWTPFAFDFTAPDGTARLQVWVHSFNASLVTAYLDELRLERLE